jgi:hypothetical protein
LEVDKLEVDKLDVDQMEVNKLEVGKLEVGIETWHTHMPHICDATGSMVLGFVSVKIGFLAVSKIIQIQFFLEPFQSSFGYIL